MVICKQCIDPFWVIKGNCEPRLYYGKLPAREEFHLKKIWIFKDLRQGQCAWHGRGEIVEKTIFFDEVEIWREKQGF